MRREIALIGLRFAGVLLLEAALLMLWFGPQRPVQNNPPGFLTPIVALELAGAPEEVFAILGPAASIPGEIMRAKVYQATMIDFLFIVCYAALNLFLALYLYYRQSISAELVFGMAFASVLMALADVQENLTLLALLQTADEAAVWKILPVLRNWTIIKWVALAVASAIAARGLWKQEEAIHSTLFGLAAALGILGILHRQAFEWQGFFLGLAWLATWYKSFPLPGSWARAEREMQARAARHEAEMSGTEPTR